MTKRVNGASIYEYPGQRCVLKLVFSESTYWLVFCIECEFYPHLVYGAWSAYGKLPFLILWVTPPPYRWTPSHGFNKDLPGNPSCGSRWVSSRQDTRRLWKHKSAETVVAVYLHRYFGSLFYITIISLICFTLKEMLNYFVLLLVCDLMTTRILISTFRWLLSN